MSKKHRWLENIRTVFRKNSWKVIALIIIGIIAILTLIVSMFTPIGNSIKPITLSENVTVSSPDFIPAISHLSNTTIASAGSISLLNNGDEFMTSVINDIANAKKSINITNYIWEDGKMMNQLFDALIAKQKEGVHVRLLVDGNGGKKIPKDRVHELELAGGKVATFRPGIPGKLTTYHMRLHRRAIVIDGEVGYTGGLGFADRWLGDASNKYPWRDVMIRMTGQSVTGIQASFAELWAATNSEVLIGDAFYPKSIKGNGSIQTVSVASSPVEDIGTLSKFISTSILAAKDSVYITTPYFIPDKSIGEALMQKARDGVDVELILPNNLTDTKSVRFAAQSFYTELLNAGVKIYEYQPTFIHSKYMVVDGIWSIVGSANMDNRSLYLNEENVIGVLDSSFGFVVTSRFMEDRAQSREITRAEWKKRNIFMRIVQDTCRLFSQQF